MRLIDADYLTTEIARLVVGGKHAIEEAGHGNFWINGLYDVKKIIDNSPTINAVPMDLHEKCMDKAVSDYIECQENKITNEDIQNAIKQGYNDGYEMARAKFERPQGEWIEKQETPASISYYCSNCEHIGLGFENFCAWCGADMRGEEK